LGVSGYLNTLLSSATGVDSGLHGFSAEFDRTNGWHQGRDRQNNVNSKLGAGTERRVIPELVDVVSNACRVK
jgi:hypothetical protein